MAKKAMTAEVIEVILIKVTEKFTESINMMIHRLAKMFSDTIDTKLAAINDRLSIIEQHVNGQHLTTEFIASSNSTVLNGQSLSSVMEAASRAMVEAEREKEDIRQRSRNIVISVLPQSHGISDASLVGSFCEQNLTVKPRIVRARRFGKN